MTCYVRHLKSLMERAGVPDKREGREALDRIVRASLELGPEAACPAVWSEVKKRTAEGPEWAEGIVEQLAGRE